ncbi:MAG: hypothetical protein A2162_08855 [Deltaproteobacteria bacterium RBG_13_52_11b]|nr:MAG: hypothetical protein A2162_08855 [Deltaproteobacteria bacterium RBG_13_52_11b]
MKASFSNGGTMAYSRLLFRSGFISRICVYYDITDEDWLKLVLKHGNPWLAQEQAAVSTNVRLVFHIELSCLKT